ncbi:acetoin utilization protein AcuC [Thioclava sp. FR2]|uniref:acetoin utilization protein AcuC n=1 Tax=Thioclava sp. FR2 TaxID=3445780 RepID=UPI003EBB6A86
MGIIGEASVQGNCLEDRAAAQLTGPLFIGSEIYRGSSYGANHPLRVPRVSTVMDLSRALGWLPSGRFRSSPTAKPAALTAWHSSDYVTALKKAEQTGDLSAEEKSRHQLGTLSNPIFPQIYSRPATGVGGVLLAAELLAQTPGAIHVPGGGTHHGMPDRANGFCYMNDPVLAMLAFRRLGLRRIAYVDIDAHHCDGVQFAFAGDSDALLISTHEENRWPMTGALNDHGGGNCFNLPVPRGFNDSEMRAALHELILPRVEAFQPDVIVLQAGADGVEEDPLARLALSNNAHIEVLRALRPLTARFLLLGGGGYNPWTVGRCWTALWAVLAGFEIPDRLPTEATKVLSSLGWGGGGRPPPDPQLLTTLRDSPREGVVREEIRRRLATLAQREFPL